MNSPAATAGSAANNSAASAGKKAVHVKWAGKTIALGTFPSAEADEKCARAKALTRAWRSTMRPKPSRDWVMLELERLGVRVVSGRLGRKAGEDGDDDSEASPAKKTPIQGMQTNTGVPAETAGSMNWGTSDTELNNLMMARRNSSLGLSIMNDVGRRGSLSSLGQAVLDSGDSTMPPHRPLVGGGAAAAYEAARHDHFTQKASEQQRRASSLGLGSLTGGNGGLGNLTMSVSANQHYEMLKLHHMNLLNEIQETTLMMNLYQQQQLQQQQQQQQLQAAHASAEMGGDPGLSMMMQGGTGTGLDMFAGTLNQRASLGLGGSQMGGIGFGNQLQLMQQQQQAQQQVQQQALMQQMASAHDGSGAGRPSTDLEGRIAQLKQDIANSDKELSEDKKRQAEGAAGEVRSKRAKKKAKAKNRNGNKDDDEELKETAI